MKLYTMANGSYLMWCPGCKHAHWFDARWKLQGTVDKPSFVSGNDNPARSHLQEGRHGRCHITVDDGKIVFAPDSAHELRGQTVEIPDWPVSSLR